jgi:hypothetical protein
MPPELLHLLQLAGTAVIVALAPYLWALARRYLPALPERPPMPGADGPPDEPKGPRLGPG